MFGKKATVAAYLVSAACLAAAGCSDDSTGPEPVPMGTVHFDMTHMVGPDPLEFNETRYESVGGRMYSVTSLYYYLCNVTFISPDGNVDFNGVHYVDASEKSTGTMSYEVPARHYDGVKFTFGLDGAHNVSNARTAPEEVHMQWPDNWGGGYHYMKLEGFVLDDEGISFGYKTHTGRFHLVAEPDSVANPHEFSFILETHMTVIEGDTSGVEVIMDTREWYRNPNAIDHLQHVQGIMDNTAMQNKIEQNGASVFRVGKITGEQGHDD